MNINWVFISRTFVKKYRVIIKKINVSFLPKASISEIGNSMKIGEKTAKIKIRFVITLLRRKKTNT